MRDASAATLAQPCSRLFAEVQSKETLRLRSVRPSILDLRFCGDPWIKAGQDGKLAIYLGDYRLASIDGLPIDLPGLNAMLDRVRHRRPRHRPISIR
jgi:hypothetical protein